MDPATATVTAAGIAAFVGAIGIVANAISTGHTMGSNRRMALDDRMWSKRSAVYEELVRHVGELKDTNEYGLESALAARVLTYASYDVLVSYRAAATAAQKADMTRTLHGAEVATAKAMPAGRAATAVQRVANYAKELDAREKESGAAADALVDLIRDELGSKPAPRRRWAWSRWPWSKSWTHASRG